MSEPEQEGTSPEVGAASGAARHPIGDFAPFAPLDTAPPGDAFAETRPVTSTSKWKRIEDAAADGDGASSASDSSASEDPPPAGLDHTTPIVTGRFRRETPPPLEAESTPESTLKLPTGRFEKLPAKDVVEAKEMERTIPMPATGRFEKVGGATEQTESLEVAADAEADTPPPPPGMPVAAGRHADLTPRMMLLGGSTPGFLAATTRTALRLASFAVRAFVTTRNVLHAVRAIPRYRAPCPVTSVGELTETTDGRGAVVSLVLGELARRGLKPVVVRGTARARMGVDAEAEVFRRQNPTARYVALPSALQAARKAIAEQAQAILVDDGFQDRRLRRDLDIVVLDATFPFGYPYLRPRGLLREPRGALGRAHLIVLVGGELLDEPARERVTREIASRSSAPIIEVKLHPIDLQKVDGTYVGPVVEIRDERVVAFTGGANPRSFFKRLEHLEAQIVVRRAFESRYLYTPADIAKLRDEARSLGAKALVTLERDAVLIAASLTPAQRDEEPPIHVLRVEAQVATGRKHLSDHIQRARDLHAKR